MLVRAADADPLAPAVLAADRERLARLAGPADLANTGDLANAGDLGGGTLSLPPLPVTGDAASLIRYARSALSKAWARARQAEARKVGA